MGLQDRDYVRHRGGGGSRGPNGGGGGPPKFPPFDPWWKRSFRGAGVPLALGIAVALIIGLLWAARGGADRLFPWIPTERSLIVNVNTATREQLETLPGIGPVRSGIILRERPFNSVDDLRRVPGVNGLVFEDIRPYVVIEGETTRID